MYDLLNKKFLKGFRFDIEMISNIEPTSCHIDYDLQLKLDSKI